MPPQFLFDQLAAGIAFGLGIDPAGVLAMNPGGGALACGFGGNCKISTVLSFQIIPSEMEELF